MFRLILDVVTGGMYAVAPGYFRHLSGPELSAFRAAGLFFNPDTADDVNTAELDIIKAAVIGGTV